MMSRSCLHPPILATAMQGRSGPSGRWQGIARFQGINYRSFDPRRGVSGWPASRAEPQLLHVCVPGTEQRIDMGPSALRHAQDIAERRLARRTAHEYLVLAGQ